MPRKIKPKFVAKSKVIEPKPPPPKPPTTPAIHLSNLTIQGLADNLKQSINSFRPVTIFFKDRANRKSELDEQHQRIVLEQINNLRNINGALVNLQADLFLSPDMLQAIITDRRQDIKRKMQLFAKKYENDMHAIDSQIKTRDHALEALELSNLDKRADINLKTAHTEEVKARALFIKYALENIDIKSMPDALQTYIVSTIFNPNGTQFNDFDMQEQIKQFVVKTSEANAKKAAAEASREEAQATMDQNTAEENTRKFNEKWKDK